MLFLVSTITVIFEWNLYAKVMFKLNIFKLLLTYGGNNLRTKWDKHWYEKNKYTIRGISWGELNVRMLWMERYTGAINCFVTFWFLLLLLEWSLVKNVQKRIFQTIICTQGCICKCTKGRFFKYLLYILINISKLLHKCGPYLLAGRLIIIFCPLAIVLYFVIYK